MRKNILYLASHVPFPPNKRDKIRTFRQIDHLSTRHNVYCACFVNDPSDAAHIEMLRRWCREVIAVEAAPPRGTRRANVTWMRGSPAEGGAHRLEMDRKLARLALAVPLDAAVAFSSMMAPHALAVSAGRRILDLCDADSQKYLDYSGRTGFLRSRALRQEGKRLRAYELACIQKFDATTVVNQREKDLLDPGGQCPRLHVVGNGVELPAAAPPPAGSLGPVIAFVGDMDYWPNVDGVGWFVDKVWPLVRKAVPGAMFLVAGRNPGKGVLRLNRVPGVYILGAVDSVSESLARSRVVVAPIRMARGLQNKVLEAMAMRRPVVLTSAVAGGLCPPYGKRYLVADEPSQMAAHIVDLCRIEALCDSIAEAGHRYVAAIYGWIENLHAFERHVLGLPARMAAMPASAVDRFEAHLGALPDILAAGAGRAVTRPTSRLKPIEESKPETQALSIGKTD